MSDFENDKVNDKISELKKVIAKTIQNSLDLTLEKKADFLGISTSELSRVISGERLPSIKRIFELEKILGKEIIKVIDHYPIEKQEISKIGDSFLGKIPRSFSEDLKLLIEEAKEYYNQKPKEFKFKFVARNKAKYLSFNLVPKGQKIGGHHLLMFHFYGNKEKPLRIVFIVRNNEESFWKEVNMSVLQTEFKKGKLRTVYNNSENLLITSENEINWYGQPFLTTKTLKAKERKEIIKLTEIVFQIQEHS